MSADADTSPATDLTPARTGRLVATLLGLLALTALEVGVVGLPVDRAARITALVGLAMTKALLMLASFLRIGRESRILRLALLAPLVLAPAFAVALMLDTAFRVTQR
jgi:Prokaryotic Cytochrome C oxidase subunit IV